MSLRPGISPEINRATESLILGIIKQDHRVGLGMASVPKLGLNIYDHEAVAYTANLIQGQAAEVLGMRGVILRQVSPESIGRLVTALGSSDGGSRYRYMMLRHGGQLLDRETGDLKGASQKIRLMQEPHNMVDPLTDQSIAEAVGLSFVLASITQEVDVRIQVRSSKNMRAAEVAVLIGRLSGANVSFDGRLTCVNYPTDRTDEEINTMLRPENKGSLRWERTIVDNVIGFGSFDRITVNVAGLIHEGVVSPNGLMIDVTHTQQTNAADVQAGREPARWTEMGFSIWRSAEMSTLFPSGLFLPDL